MSHTILFVDDEQIMLDTLRRQMGRKFQVLTANGAEEGLRCLATDDSIAVIIADMRMPGTSGLELLRQVKSRYPHVVRGMLTGNVDRQTAVDAVDQGEVFHFLTKPCESSVLVKSIEMCLEMYEVQSRIQDLNAS